MRQSAITAIIGLILVIFSPIIAKDLPLLSFLGACSFLFCLALLARPKQANSPLHSFLHGLSVAISILTITASIVYYCSTVTTISLTISALVTLGICFSIGWNNTYEDILSLKIKPLIAASVAGSPLLVSLYFMSANLITTAVRSPWTTQNTSAILIPLGVSIALTAIFAYKKLLTTETTIILIGATIFTTTTFAAIAYPLGYGFDPHIHRATMEHIAANGTITPKPLYYIGMYALELIANMLFAIPIKMIDAYLSPLLISLSLMLFISTRDKNKQIATLFIIPLIPLSAFIQTTPNAVSLSFLVMTIAFAHSNAKHAALTSSIAALLAHPIAGLPALLISAYTYLEPYLHKIPNIRSMLLITASTLLLPAAFIADALIAKRDFSIHIPSITQLIQKVMPSITLYQQTNAVFDTLYTLTACLGIVTCVTAIAGYILIQKRDRFFGEIALGHVIAGTIISSAFSFSYLIAYEQNDFAARAITIAGVITLPLLMKAAEGVHEKVSKQGLLFQTGTAICLAAALSGTMYITYPRHDAYASSAGFNVAQTDLDAVQEIEAYADERKYAVLGNQAISAAAIETFGFTDRYLKNETYFYPIPTSGPLYSLFLAFVEEEQSQDVVDRAFALTDAEILVIVIHDYWWNAQNITQNATAIADDVLTLPEGVKGFVFTRASL